MIKTDFLWVCFLVLLMSCNSDNETIAGQDDDGSLATLVAQNTIEIDNVIACASGSENPNEIIAYVYPRPGASDIRYFETETVTVDKNDYQNYTQVLLPEGDFFNGYLKTFTQQTAVEKWVIISFRESGILHLSNPIRLKHQTQNTHFTDMVSIDQSQTGMPLFNWEPLVQPQDAIYFQVVSDASNELLSGTYTFEPQFRYYQLENVVLNITEETPPELISQTPYGYTVMGVSEDNWVNTLLQAEFVLED
ncbi:hypothetical protein [Dokdonia pacifica]|uniref:Uncharacterized protein n=1 Tax=Dokdonia pacifica TaxID=1627892 RepID=A0A239AG55_9FLAO|nr:hypothetical protein [Dokdonia pacifica]SNR94530.1 hypothetical protein SAMN06265376_104409 [Dokdonia pacifica]